MAQLAKYAAESLDARIGNEHPNELAEAAEVRRALECLQALSLEASEAPFLSGSASSLEGSVPRWEESQRLRWGWYSG
jgi:hypothetical protein